MILHLIRIVAAVVATVIGTILFLNAMRETARNARSHRERNWGWGAFALLYVLGLGAVWL